MVHSKDATLNNSHVPGPDSMMPEGKKKIRERNLKMFHKIHFYSTWSYKSLVLLVHLKSSL